MLPTTHVHRRELYHCQRELLRERTRCKALEEELENPMNIHRWRKLEVQKNICQPFPPEASRGNVFVICVSRVVTPAPMR